MNRIHKSVLLGVLLGTATACESPTLFRDTAITLTPLEDPQARGPQATRQATVLRAPSTYASASRTAAAAPRIHRTGTRTVFRTVTTKQQPRVMIFDVRDLLAATPSFVAPEMDVFGSGGQPEYPEPAEAQAFIDEGTLLDALRAALPEDLLSEESEMRIVGGRLIVTNPPK